MYRLYLWLMINTEQDARKVRIITVAGMFLIWVVGVVLEICFGNGLFSASGGVSLAILLPFITAGVSRLVSIESEHALQERLNWAGEAFMRRFVGYGVTEQDARTWLERAIHHEDEKQTAARAKRKLLYVQSFLAFWGTLIWALGNQAVALLNFWSVKSC